jgi:hypothetical protein
MEESIVRGVSLFAAPAWPNKEEILKIFSLNGGWQGAGRPKIRVSMPDKNKMFFSK